MQFGDKIEVHLEAQRKVLIGLRIPGIDPGSRALPQTSPDNMAYVPPHKRTGATPAPSGARESWAEAQRRMEARRAPAPAPAPVDPAPEPAVASGGSLADWLREARKGYVPKSPAEITAELATLNYDQLRKRAGPPPSITSDDYGGAHEQGGEGEGARVCGTFDESLRLFKRGIGGPPEPLCFDGRDDGEVICDGIAEEVYVGQSKAQKLRSAYASWYAQWGARLNHLWRAEHPQLQKATAKPTPKPQPTRTKPAEPEYKPSRILEVSEHSGW